MSGKKRELLFSVTRNDFDLQTFRSGGPGGQHQNKRDSGVRIIHRESGARGESRKKSQFQNRKLAFERLVKTPEFQSWLNRKAAKETMTITERQRRERDIQQSVSKQLRPENLRVEWLIDSKWVEAASDV